MSRSSVSERARTNWNIKPHENLRIVAKRCGKEGCRGCPHSYYAYATSGVGNAKKHRYLGTCNQIGEPRKAYQSQLFGTQ